MQFNHFALRKVKTMWSFHLSECNLVKAFFSFTFLYKTLFFSCRGQRVTKSEAGGSLDSTGPNPFADRPSTARTNTQNKAYMDQAMEELDRDSNCPDGVPPHVWERLCMYRRQKVEYETQVSGTGNFPCLNLG